VTPARRDRLGSLAALLTPVVIFWLLDFLQPGYFYRNDAQTQHIPLYAENARAWLHGEIPLLSPCCWNAANISGQYLSGTFNIFNQVLFILAYFIKSEPTRVLFISAVCAAIASAGFYRLGRSWGWPVVLAWSGGACATLNGWNVYICYRDWTEDSISFTWIPWLWWALDTREETPRQRVTLWLSIYLALTAGCYFAILMVVLLLVSYFVRALFRRDWYRLYDTVLGFCAGFAMALPPLLLLLVHSFTGNRPHGLNYERLFHPIFFTTLFLPFRNLVTFGQAFPAKFVQWTYWQGYFMVGYDYGIGFLPAIALVVAALTQPLRFVKRRPVPWFLCCAAFVLACAPMTGGGRWSVRWSPFLFGVMAMLGHEGLLLIHRRRKRAQKARFAPFLLPLVPLASAGVLFAVGVEPAVISSAAMPGLCVAFIWMLIWIAGPRLRLSATSLLSVAIVTSSLNLQVTTDDLMTQPAYAVQEGSVKPLDRSRLYLSLYTVYEYVQWTRAAEWNILRPGDRAMIEGAQVVNGYDSMEPLPLNDSLQMGFLGYLQLVGGSSSIHEAGPHGLLETWGVDGLIVSPTFRPLADSLLPQRGWKKVSQAARTSVWERAPLPEYYSASNVTIPEQRPAQLISMLIHDPGKPVSAFLPDQITEVPSEGEFGTVKVTDFHSFRNGVKAQVQTDSKPRSLLVLRRVYAAGYRARLNGKELQVGVYNGANLGVLIPGGQSGKLEVYFSPPAFPLSLAVFFVGMLLGAFWAFAAGTDDAVEGPKEPAAKV
jgi:hypothetical protein